MATSIDVTLTGGWDDRATAGEVLITCLQEGVLYRITNDAVAPTSEVGHVVTASRDVALTLTGTERLWLKGDSSTIVTITADAPV